MDRNERVLTSASRKKALEELAAALVEQWMNDGLYRSCLNCDHWDQVNEICTTFKERPPAKVIVCGCEHHIDEIPF